MSHFFSLSIDVTSSNDYYGELAHKLVDLISLALIAGCGIALSIVEGLVIMEKLFKSFSITITPLRKIHPYLCNFPSQSKYYGFIQGSKLLQPHVKFNITR